MKRTVLLVLAVLCLVSLFACNQTSNEPRELVFLGAPAADAISDFSLPDAPLQTNYETRAALEGKTRTFHFAGTDYTLSYQETLFSDLSPYSEDVYEYFPENKEGLVSVRFRSDTDEFVSFSRTAGSTKASAVTPNPELVSEEDFRAYAQELLSDYADVSGWEYSCSTNQTRKTQNSLTNDYLNYFCPQAVEECDSFENLYTFTFSKRVAGFLSDEAVRVALQPDGQLRTLSLSCLGEMEEFEDLGITEAELVSLAKETAQATYRENAVLSKIEPDAISLFKTPDGTPCFRVALSLEYAECDESLCDCQKELILYFAAAPGGKLPASLRAD